MAVDPSALRLCLVTDRGLSRGRPLDEIVAAAARGGATMVQLREKTLETRDFLEAARALKAFLKPLAIKLLINDRLDIALAIEADGLHVGQSDMPVGEARRWLGPDRIIGLSITDPHQLAGADAAQADYLGVGPIFAQTTKADASPPLGLSGLAACRRLTTKPLMAIGGLTPANSAQALAAGADGLAVVSAIVAADDPETATRSFASLWR